MDYSWIIATLYLYLSKIIKSENARLPYGLVLSASTVFSITCSLVCGRYIDKHRKVKFFLNVTLILQIIGNCIYVIPFSIAFPVIGRAFVGMGDTARSVMIAEIVRIYGKEESTKVLWWFWAADGLGILLAPYYHLHS